MGLPYAIPQRNIMDDHLDALEEETGPQIERLRPSWDYLDELFLNKGQKGK